MPVAAFVHGLAARCERVTRSVPSAIMGSVGSPITGDGTHGVRAEEDARQIAARLGVADFVYRAPMVSKGAATREVGDALLISNGRGAVLQVKSRDPSASETGAARILKRASKAYKQGIGSLREIARHRDSGQPLSAIPVRAQELGTDEQRVCEIRLDFDVDAWPVVVIIDHPDADGVIPPEGERGFWITLNDWHGLNRALRSVSGLLEYMERVQAHGATLSVPLGAELDRFATLVEADAEYSASGPTTSRPWLSFDALRDPVGAESYRQLLGGVWPVDSAIPTVPIEEVRRVLEFLDATPPGAQTELGRWVLKKRRELKETGRWGSGAVLFERRKLLVFACDSDENGGDLDDFDGFLATLAAVRALEITEKSGEPCETLAIGHRVDATGVDYRYALVPAPLPVPENRRRSTLHSFGTFDLARMTVMPLRAGRNEQCPCGSGRKFKYCKGSG